MNARSLVVVFAGLLLTACAGTQEQPAGTGSRTLSPVEVDALLEGRGMGMAAVAEINGYPGPMHVLELKDELRLTPDQRFATSRLLGLTQGQVRAVGQRIINAEQQLDADMAAGKLTSEQVRSRIQTIAALRGQLRHLHVDAHLQQQKILNSEQLRRYYELRGRKVIVPAPQVPLPVTEPLRLPVMQPVEEPAPETMPQPVPAEEAPSDLPLELPTVLPSESPSVLPSDVMPDIQEPAVPASEGPQAAPETLTPGMRDAMDEAEPAPPLPAQQETTFEDEASERPEAAPATVTSPGTLTPGMRDAMDDAEPAPPLPAQEELTPEDEAARLPEPAPLPATSPESLTPGMRDAMDDAEPVPPQQANNAPALSPPAPKTAAANAEKRVRSPRSLTPGMQDAMEFAEPAPAEEDIYIAPLETAEDDYEPLPPLDDREPVTVTLDN